MIRKIIRLFFIIVICVAIGSRPSVQAESSPNREYLIKAAFLYNFAKFVNWPDEAFPDRQTRLSLCIVGKDPFGDALSEAIKGKTVKGRKLAVQYTNRIESIKQCHTLFISTSEEKRLSEILDYIGDRSVLTVSNIKDFARRGGIINFITVESKVRFEINVDAAQAAGLKVSSNLLRLAKVVRNKKEVLE